jgi:hypothetical protein
MQKGPSLNLVYRKNDLYCTDYDTLEQLQGNDDEDHPEGPMICTLHLPLDDCFKLCRLYQLGKSKKLFMSEIASMKSDLRLNISYVSESDELLLYDYFTYVEIRLMTDFETGKQDNPKLTLVLQRCGDTRHKISICLNMQELLNFATYHLTKTCE